MVKSERSVLFKKETWQVVSSYLFTVGMWLVEIFSIKRSAKCKNCVTGSEQVPWTKDSADTQARRLHLIDLSECLFNRYSRQL